MVVVKMLDYTVILPHPSLLEMRRNDEKDLFGILKRVFCYSLSLVSLGGSLFSNFGNSISFTGLSFTYPFLNTPAEEHIEGLAMA